MEPVTQRATGDTPTAAQRRAQTLATLATTMFDVCIIGGGATGRAALSMRKRAVSDGLD